MIKVKKKLISLFSNPKIFLTKIKKKLVLLMTNPLGHFIFDPLEKLINPYPKESSIKGLGKGYSVVIITGADDLAMLEDVIISIDQELAGTPAEIILVGPAKIKLSRQFNVPVKIITYRDIKFLTPMITRKKNLGVKSCQYNKVVVTHDYVLFEAGWRAGWDRFGDDFDIAMNKMKNQDGSRFRDWLAWDYPGIGVGFLPYTAEVTPYQFINGTYFVIKRDFYLANPLNEKLRWGEGEDIEWSKRIRTKTVFKFNPHSSVKCAKFKPPIKDWDNNSMALQKIFSQELLD